MSTRDRPRPAGQPDAEAGTGETDRRRGRTALHSDLMVLLCIGGAAALVDLNSSPGVLWFPWMLGVWGAALLVRYATPFVRGVRAPPAERNVDRELRHRHAGGTP